MDIRDTMKEALEGDGYEVSIAPNGVEGLKFLDKDQSPCMIFLDLMMHGMDGYEFIQRKNEISKLQTIPVVVISAANISETKIGELLADGYIKKPLQLSQLLDTASKFCQLKKETNSDKSTG